MKAELPCTLLVHTSSAESALLETQSGPAILTREIVNCLLLHYHCCRKWELQSRIVPQIVLCFNSFAFIAQKKEKTAIIVLLKVVSNYVLFFIFTESCISNYFQIWVAYIKFMSSIFTMESMEIYLSVPQCLMMSRPQSLRPIEAFFSLSLDDLT